MEKSGSWFSYNGEKVGQGRENAKKWLENNPEIMDTIQSQIKERFLPKTTTENAENA